MSVSERLLKFGLSATVALLSAGTLVAQNDNSEVVASVGGVKVTMAELEQEESAKLLSAQYQYYQAQTKALNDLVDKKLLERAPGFDKGHWPNMADRVWGAEVSTYYGAKPYWT